MSTYTPDRWVIVRLWDDKDSYNKVFSGSYGGFAGSDTWKLSSAIVNTMEDDEKYTMTCESGSIYVLYKQAYGMSSYMHSIYSNWAAQSEKPGADVKIEVLKEYVRTL